MKNDVNPFSVDRIVEIMMHFFHQIFCKSKQTSSIAKSRLGSSTIAQAWRKTGVGVCSRQRWELVSRDHNQ